MDQKTRLLTAIQQLHNVANLIKENDYRDYMCGKLIICLLYTSDAADE